MNTLEALKRCTRITADTGDAEEIRRWKPEEATTNPTLILNLFQSSECETTLDEAYELAHADCKNSKKGPTLQAVCRACLVTVAKQILNAVPGRVSIEADARVASDTKATTEEALNLIKLCQKASVDTKRILIKVVATWEGIQSMKALEKKDIACNGTLIFHEVQALACAQANVTLISPFVGRIFDYYVTHGLWNEGEEDPGVRSVRRIFELLKSQSYKTEIMGASFRNVNEILALAGCDRLTIAPKYLEQLSHMNEPVEVRLKIPKAVKKSSPLTEAEFREQLSKSDMATEKLTAGIASFSRDCQGLNELIMSYLDMTERLYVR